MISSSFLYKSVIIFLHHPHWLVRTYFEVGANSLPAGVHKTAFFHHAAGGGIAWEIGAPQRAEPFHPETMVYD